MKAKEIYELSRLISISIYQEFATFLTIGIYVHQNREIISSIRDELDNIKKNHQEILELQGFYIDEKTNQVYFDMGVDFKEDSKKYLN